MSIEYEVGGYHWDHDATLPPPPHFPDSVSVDSNTDIPSLNLSLLPPIVPDSGGDGIAEDGACGASGGAEDPSWPIPHPNEYLLPHAQEEEEDSSPARPVALRNRYQEKTRNNNLNAEIGTELEDEINENCSLLCGPPPPQQPTIEPSKGRKTAPKPNPPSPRKPQKPPTNSSSVFAPNSTSNSHPRKQFSKTKTTHITEV